MNAASGHGAIEGRYPLPTPAWLQRQYGIRWDGQCTPLSGTIARVVTIRRTDPDQMLVLRLSDPGRLPRARIEQVHRFQAYLQARGVRTGRPLSSLEGQTVATTENGDILEIFPFIPGRPPRRGDRADIRLVADALARLHRAGAAYLDLPDAESLNQNHVALNHLRRDIRRARKRAPGKAFADLYLQYTDRAEQWITALQALHDGLVETALHLDTAPQNMLIDEAGRLWFIDCGHMLRGRRVFEVCVSIFYMDPCSAAPQQDPRRYHPPDPVLAALFLQHYQAACTPPWNAAEDRALALEHMLLLIHGATYWATSWDEYTVQDELIRFGPYWRTLQAQIER